MAEYLPAEPAQIEAGSWSQNKSVVLTDSNCFYAGMDSGTTGQHYQDTSFAPIPPLTQSFILIENTDDTKMLIVDKFSAVRQSATAGGPANFVGTIAESGSTDDLYALIMGTTSRNITINTSIALRKGRSLVFYGCIGPSSADQNILIDISYRIVGA